jgi:hypothetical protein
MFAAGEAVVAGVDALNCWMPGLGPAVVGCEKVCAGET